MDLRFEVVDVPRGTLLSVLVISTALPFAQALQPSFSWTILLTLIVLFLVSLTMYTLVVVRWTTRRHWVSLAEWSSEHRMKVGRITATELPPPLDRLREVGAKIRLRIGDKQTSLIQFQTLQVDGRPQIWNVVIRKSQRLHAPAALRPEHVDSSLIDLFDLTAFHSLSTSRFAVMSVDIRSARQLIQSPARALLPPDIGLLVVGEQIVLDFSARPFDPVELDRMLSVMRQIVDSVGGGQSAVGEKT